MKGCAAIVGFVGCLVPVQGVGGRWLAEQHAAWGEKQNPVTSRLS
jgi:hypothetical protein